MVRGARKGDLNNCLIQLPGWLITISGDCSFCGRKQRKKTKLIHVPLKIVAWNVHTLMDSSGSERRELDRHGIEIAALSETLFRDRGDQRSLRWLHIILEWTKK